MPVQRRCQRESERGWLRAYILRSAFELGVAPVGTWHLSPAIIFLRRIRTSRSWSLEFRTRTCNRFKSLSCSRLYRLTLIAALSRNFFENAATKQLLLKNLQEVLDANRTQIC